MAKNMAIIVDGIVENIIYCEDLKAETDSVKDIGDIPVGIGDSYHDGKFYRDGSEVLGYFDMMEKAHTEELAALIEEIYNEDLEVIG